MNWFEKIKTTIYDNRQPPELENKIKIEETKEEAKPEGIKCVSWAEAVALRNDGLLETDKRYRIIDYVTTTSTHDTKSAMHHFDLILTPLSEKEFSSDVKPVRDTYDPYFNDCDINAWELKYCLDNDRARFAWADEKNGKGVIYYMKDEWGNEAPYDFKNIMFRRWCIEGHEHNKGVYFGVVDPATNTLYPTGSKANYDYGEFYYTFSGISYANQDVNPEESAYLTHNNLRIYDMTTYPFRLVGKVKEDKDGKSSDLCLGNVIKETFDRQAIRILPNNVFISYPSFWKEGDDGTFSTSLATCIMNFMDTACFGNTVCGEATGNKFGIGCSFNIIKKNGNDNRFMPWCRGNFMEKDCLMNVLDTQCNDNVFNVSNGNVLGKYCSGNSIKLSNSNFLNNVCIENTVYDSNYNMLGVGSHENRFNDATGNKFGSFCIGNVLNGATWNSFGDNCTFNELGKKTFYNDFGYNCNSNSLADECESNSFLGDVNFVKLDRETCYQTKEKHTIGEDIAE